MSRGEFVVSHFMKITKLKDQNATIGDKDCVMMAMTDLPYPWQIAMAVISDRTKYIPSN